MRISLLLGHVREINRVLNYSRSDQRHQCLVKDQRFGDLPRLHVDINPDDGAGEDLRNVGFGSTLKNLAHLLANKSSDLS
jgi:hypothetical protein